MKTKKLWGGMVLSLGSAALLAGCATPCSPCGNGPMAVRERTVAVVQTTGCERVVKSCKTPCEPCIYTQTNTGLDGW